MEHLDYKDRANLLAAILNTTVAETTNKVDLPFSSGNLVTTTSENSDHASSRIVETVQNWILTVLGLSTTYNAPLDGLRNRFIILLWGVACACTVVFLIVDLFLEDGLFRSLLSPRSRRRNQSPGSSPAVSPASRIRRNVFYNERKSDLSPSTPPSKATLILLVTGTDLLKSNNDNIIDKYIISLQDDTSIILLILVNDQEDVTQIRDQKCIKAISEHKMLFIQTATSILPMIKLLGKQKVLTTFHLPDDIEDALKNTIGNSNINRCNGISDLEQLIQVIHKDDAEFSVCDMDQN